MDSNALLPHLFRTEYRKLVSVLCYMFGIEHIETAEDIVSDTFLTATETWSIYGLPANPTAWLYAVAKNKTKNHLKHDGVFRQKVSAALQYSTEKTEEIEIDLSRKNIVDSQLAMIFTVCNPVIPADAQIALALHLLCGFGTAEVADAFLTSREAVYKRLQRAREKLKQAKLKIEQPDLAAIDSRLETVLTTLYLLFSEGYYSTSQNTMLRKDFCAEAMRLTSLLAENSATSRPAVYALLALMCFHASRFDARMGANGEVILYEDQDERLWDRALIEQGTQFLNLAASGSQISKFHLEAGIAYWHTIKEDSTEKWENILDLYNERIILEYSPIAALNRTFALSRVRGKLAAITEAEKLQLTENHFYYLLLGHLYTDIDNTKALKHFETALSIAVSATDKTQVSRHILRLQQATT